MRTPADHVERKGKRLSVGLPSRVRHAGDRDAAAEIANISFYGLRATSGADLSRGEFISVALPTVGLVRARVAWAHDGAFGAVFLRPVDVRSFLLPPRAG